MPKNRVKTNLVHQKGRDIFEISREKKSGKFFIKNTDQEVPADKLRRKQNQKSGNKSNYDFSKPYQAQELGDEWDDYAWSADDY